MKAPAPTDQPPPGKSEVSRGRDWSAWLLAIGAVAGPLAFGSTESWAYCGLQILTALAAGFWMLGRPRIVWMILLPLAAAVLGALQLAPLPESFVSQIAPRTFEARQEAQQLTGLAAENRVALDYSRGEAGLRRCLMLALIVVIVSDLAREERYRRRLMMGVALSGAVILALGLTLRAGPGDKALGFHQMQGVFRHYKNPLLTGFHSQGVGYTDEVAVGPIRYTTNSPVVGSAFGAMINANHFAALIGLTTPLVVGLLLAGWKSRGPAFGAAFFYFLAANYAVAIPAHSRGGIMAMLLSTAAVMALCWIQNRAQARKALVLAGLILSGIAAAAVVLGVNQKLGGRWIAWQTAVEMFAGSPLLGIGLGNFGAAYPAYHDRVIVYLAHSAWIETLAEGGVIGVAIVAIFTGALVWIAGRIWTWTATGPRRGLRLALAAGLLFAAFHGAIDHGIQIPAAAFVCAMMIGLLLGDLAGESSSDAARRSPGCFVIIFLAVYLAWFGGKQIDADAMIRPLRRAVADQQAAAAAMSDAQKIEALRAAMPAAERAFEMDFQNADYAEVIGQAYIHLSRGKSGAELKLAEKWFGMCLHLCPGNPWVKKTLLELQAANRAAGPGSAVK